MLYLKRSFLLALCLSTLTTQAASRRCKPFAAYLKDLTRTSAPEPIKINYKAIKDSTVPESDLLFVQELLVRKKTAEIDHVFQEVNQFINHRLKMPSEIDLHLRRRTTDKFSAFINPAGGDRVYIEGALQFSPNGYLKPEVYAQHALAHELGHHILHLNLFEQKSLYYKRVQELVPETKAAGIRVLELYDRKQDALKALNNSAVELGAQEKAALELNYQSILKEEVEASSALQKLQAEPTFLLNQFLGPYDELFADAIAVGRSGDGRAIRGAFDYKGPLTPHAKYRDFTAGIDKVPKEALNSKVGYYWLLSPVRSHIWDNYLSKFKALSERRAEFYKNFFESIHEEINLRMAEGRIDPSVDPERINRDLIKRIDQKMAGY